MGPPNSGDSKGAECNLGVLFVQEENVWFMQELAQGVRPSGRIDVRVVAVLDTPADGPRPDTDASKLPRLPRVTPILNEY